MSEQQYTKHGWPITPVADMTTARARADAIACRVTGGMGGGTPGGVSYATYAYAGSLGWPRIRVKPGHIAIWYAHDPEQRVWQFSIAELKAEAESGVAQLAMPL